MKQVGCSLASVSLHHQLKKNGLLDEKKAAIDILAA